jgi:hypothetical protein
MSVEYKASRDKYMEAKTFTVEYRVRIEFYSGRE